MSKNLAKVFGALNLLNEDGLGSLDSIDVSILKEHDIGMVFTPDGFYVYELFEAPGKDVSVPPFSVKNPPLVIKPLDTDTDKRWVLIHSSKYIIGDVSISDGNQIIVNKIGTSDGFQIVDTESGEPIIEYKDGKIHLKDIIVPNIKADNIDVDTINGKSESLYVLRNGSRPFTKPISGQTPEEPSHLTTKKYVDDMKAELEPDNIMRRDGSTAFSAPVLGIMPIEKLHLTPKQYVDEEIEHALNKVSESIGEVSARIDTKIIAEDVKTNKTVDANDRTLVIIEDLEDDISVNLIGNKQGDVVYIKNYNTTDFSIRLISLLSGHLVEKKESIFLDKKIKGCTLYFDGRDWFVINTMT